MHGQQNVKKKSYNQFLLKLARLYFSFSVLHGQALCIYDGCSEKNSKVYFVVASDCSPQHYQAATHLGRHTVYSRI
jgi:hypothetical protein